MGRRRKNRKDLPQRVYFDHGAYFFVDRNNRWHKLARDYVKAMTRYAELFGDSIGGETMGAVLNRYLKEISPKKSPRTQKNHLQESKRLRAVFGHMAPRHITPQDIYRYMDERKAPVAANREVALLSSLFKNAIRWGLVSDNPCRLVSRNPERPRDREVTDSEFSLVRAMAPEAVRCAMDLAEMTGLRLGDILRVNDRENVLEDGLFVITGKRKKKMLFYWTPELRTLHERCKKLPRNKASKNVASFYWISNRDGQPYGVDGFESLWQRVMIKAVQEKVIAERFTFHDLRSRAGDMATNATELLGHDDPRTTNRVYRRRTRKVLPNRPTQN